MEHNSTTPPPAVTPTSMPRIKPPGAKIGDDSLRRKKYRAIQLRIVFHLAMRNITSKKLRSFLTVFGVVIGIGSIFFLLSFGIGIQDLVTRQVIGDKSLKALDVTSPNSRILQLDDTAVNKIRTFPHVEKVGLQYSFPGSVAFGGGEVDTVVYGINNDYQSTTSFNVRQGRLLNKDDTRAVVLNSSALKAIGIEDQGKAINQQITLTIPLQKIKANQKEIRDKFTIVGVIESGAGSEIFTISEIFTSAGVPSFQQIKVVSDDTKHISSLRKQIESNGFQTASLVDTLEEINKIFKFFNVILVSFGSIGMIVAVLGMFNTLTISLLERTKEIGLMMALGGRRSDMRKLFIFEALLISLAGAVIGIALAVVGGTAVNTYLNAGAKGRGVSQSFSVFAYPAWIVVSVIVFTMFVGLAVVYFPARRAEKINPIDALRRE
ncbi:ABC transporter permease [Candidatus Saccharibacteria bacterium]|nr:ABC transporter permease [Candidatus Saccharibacteria bacterium]